MGRSIGALGETQAQARPRDQGARGQVSAPRRVSARADGPARQAGGSAGGRWRPPIRPASRRRSMACPASSPSWKSSRVTPPSWRVPASPASTASCRRCGPTPAVSAQRLDTLKGEVEERLKSAAKAADLAPLATKLALAGAATCRHSSRAKPTARPAPPPMPRRCCSPSSSPT